MRLLKLPTHIQKDISDGLLTEGHGRALVKLIENPQKLQSIRNEIIKGNLSVRSAEKLVKKATSSKIPKKTISKQNVEELPQSFKSSIITQLTNKLNSKVQITENGSRGKIEIEYYSVDDLDRLTAVLLEE